MAMQKIKIRSVLDGSIMVREDDGHEKNGSPMAYRQMLLGALSKRAPDGEPAFLLLEKPEAFQHSGLPMSPIQGSVWSARDDARLERFLPEREKRIDRARARLDAGAASSLPLEDKIKAEAKIKAAKEAAAKPAEVGKAPKAPSAVAASKDKAAK